MSMTPASVGEESRMRDSPPPRTRICPGNCPAISRLVGIGDDLGYSAEPDRRGQVDVGLQQDGDGAQSRQRGDSHQGAWPGFHQDADVLALGEPRPRSGHARRCRCAGSPLRRYARVRRRFLFGASSGLFVDDPAQRDPGVVVDLAQSGAEFGRSRRPMRTSDLFAATGRGAGGAAVQASTPHLEASPSPCISRELRATPGSVGSSG